MSDSALPHVLVAYPEAFGCYAKFARKLDRLLAHLGAIQLCYQEDPRHWLEEYARSRSAPTGVAAIASLDAVALTHAILFKDSHHLNELAQQCQQRSLLLRVVPIVVTRVVNIDKKEPYEVYIGRGSPWGNPYAVGFGLSPGEEQDDRAEAIRKFQYDFQRDFLKSKQSDYRRLIGKVLGCHCKPAPCHGDVIVEYLNGLDDGR